MENEIKKSWEVNAKEWVKVIDSGSIPSRHFTNRAIMEVLKTSKATKILDIGCGEGWLTRSITAMGKEGVGIDAIEALLENAQTKGPEPYYRLSFEEIMGGAKIPLAPFEAAVFNFCLYQEVGLPILLQELKKNMVKEGEIIIQTLHPYFLIKNGLGYKSQTISNSWKGLPGNFIQGHDWYARTLENWIDVFIEANLQVKDLLEIINDKNEPISLIMILV
ncbi:MAG: class I SAM-dependent methyltransferase [Maribacter sp.]